MTPSSNCAVLVQAFEQLGDGNKATALFEPYLCPSKIYTVGWGHALTTPAGKPVSTIAFGPSAAAEIAKEAMLTHFGKTALSRQECDDLFQKDLNSFAVAIEKDLPADTTPTQFDAFTSIAYNIGSGAFKSSTFLKLHNAGERSVGDISFPGLAKAARNKIPESTFPIAFVRWSYDAQGQFLLGLFRRRLAELLVYSGWDAGKAVQTAQEFNG